MADKEIGLFQVRTGKQRNLPTALEHAELTLTTDECRMFVGLPATITPASLVSGRRNRPGGAGTFLVQGSGEENVEIMTEFTPPHVLNRMLNQHTIIHIAPTDDGDPGTLVQIPYVSRIIIDYVAYNSDGTTLNSGTATMLSTQAGETDPTVLLAQTNNTSHPHDAPAIEIATPEFEVGYMKFYVKNISNEPYVFEFSYKGWDQS